MAPRNTKHGAPASGRRAPVKRTARATASSRSANRKPSTSRTRSSRKPAAGRPSFRLPQSARRFLLPVSALLICAVFAWTYYPVLAVQYRETREKTKLASELSTLRERNGRLREQVERLKTPAGVEDYARSQLGMVKRGENVMVVVDSKATTSGADKKVAVDSDETKAPAESSWTAFLDLIFGVR